MFIMCNMRTILLSSSSLQVGLNKQLYLSNRYFKEKQQDCV